MYKNILILGAETSFGIYLTNYLLSLNYFVSILISDKRQNEIQNTNLEIIKGDILDYESLRFATAGQQVVINVLNYSDFKLGLISVISQNIVHAINTNYVDKYIGLTPIGSGKTRDKLTRVNKVLNYLKFNNSNLNEYTFQESLFSKSAIDYTIVQVGRIISRKHDTESINIIASNKVKNPINIRDFDISEARLSSSLYSIMVSTRYNKTSVLLEVVHI